LTILKRNESNTETRDAIRALGRRSEIVTCDLADKASVKALTKKVVGPKSDGGMGETIDILINCGGIQRR
jgi:2-deoxy-D-gluconate 3-dehydrogenase